MKDAGAELTAVELVLDMGSEYEPLAPARAVSQMRSDRDLAREERNEWRDSHDKLTARVEELQAEVASLRAHNSDLVFAFPWSRARDKLADLERLRAIGDNEHVQITLTCTEPIKVAGEYRAVESSYAIAITAGALRRIMGR